MASFKVIAGDFGQGKSGQVLGHRYRPSSQGMIMPQPSSSFQTERIAPGQIEALEVATEEGLKKMAGSIGWGVAGALVAGPIGALAGTLAGGKSTEVTFICRFKDGRSFLGQCNAKTFTLIQAARFPVAASSVTKPHPIAMLIVLACLIGFFVWVAHLVPNQPAKSSTANLNQPAVGLVTYLLTDDAKGMLVRDQRSAVWPKIGALLGWLDLAWSLPATSYESDYDANEISADNEYKGQRLLISGTISTVSKNFANEGYVTLRGSGLMGVQAKLSQTGTVSAASFRKGQKVNLVCTGSGETLTVATLENCETLDDYINRLSPSMQSRVADFLSGEKTLGNADASPIVSMYITAVHMPADSPCLNGKRSSCMAEMKAVLADKAQAEIIRAQVKMMMASMKTN